MRLHIGGRGGSADITGRAPHAVAAGFSRCKLHRSGMRTFYFDLVRVRDLKHGVPNRCVHKHPLSARLHEGDLYGLSLGCGSEYSSSINARRYLGNKPRESSSSSHSTNSRDERLGLLGVDCFVSILERCALSSPENGRTNAVRAIANRGAAVMARAMTRFMANGDCSRPRRILCSGARLRRYGDEPNRFTTNPDSRTNDESGRRVVKGQCIFTSDHLPSAHQLAESDRVFFAF